MPVRSFGFSRAAAQILSIRPFSPAKAISSSNSILATELFQISIVAQLALQSGQRQKPKHMTEEQQIAIGANCILIVLTSLYIFINVFY